MNFPKLLKLEQLPDRYDDYDFSKTIVIAIQHILGSNGSLFELLANLGLPYDHMFILGKVYSTNLDVYEELRKRGAFLHPDSVDLREVTLLQDYKATLRDAANDLLETALIRLGQLKGDKTLLVVDDGGVLISVVNEQAKHINARIVAVEQTRSGAETIRSVSELKFPVINVAESDKKLKDESPYIATSVIHHISSKLGKPISKYRTAVIGDGSVGSQIALQLKSQAKSVSTYDTKVRPASSSTSTDLHATLKSSDLVIGCVGKAWLPTNYTRLIRPSSVLASASSSNTEFLGIRLDRSSGQHSPLELAHEDYQFSVSGGKATVLSAGFPVNFDGSEDPISPEVIVLTRMLMLSGILQALTTKTKSGLTSLKVTF